MPEVRHQIGVRIAAQSARAVRGRRELLSIVQEVVLVQTAFEERPRVDARRAVRLEEHEIAAMIAIARAKEVIEADLEQIGGAGVACDVTAKLAVGSVGAHDHCKSIPAHQRSQTLFYREVAGKHWLVAHRHRIDVRGR